MIGLARLNGRQSIVSTDGQVRSLEQRAVREIVVIGARTEVQTECHGPIGVPHPIHLNLINDTLKDIKEQILDAIT